MKKYLLPETGNFYKANLHCHSTVSDGSLTPEQIKKAYMERGYSIIAYTDHNVMIDHSDLAEENFLPLRGYELNVSPDHKIDGLSKTCHFCFIALEPDNKTQVLWHREKYLNPNNTEKYRDQVIFDETKPDYERVYSAEGVSEMFRTGRENGFFVTYNHPAWSLETAQEFLGYHHMHAMEICNFACIEMGYDDYSPAIYDEILRHGERIFCVANDDNHNRGENWTHDSFGGFNIIKAEALDYRTITRALEAGDFYASQGPEIYDLYVEDNVVHITCSPARRIAISSGMRFSNCVWAKEGETITEAAFELRPECNYFRLTVFDTQGRPANTRAYFMDELN